MTEASCLGLTKFVISAFLLRDPENSNARLITLSVPSTVPLTAFFCKVGRLASEEVVVQLLLHKFMPILLYALDVCALDKRSVQSLDFTINRFFMKLFKTSSIVTVRDCQSFFGVDLPSIVLAKTFYKFVGRYGNTYI